MRRSVPCFLVISVVLMLVSAATFAVPRYVVTDLGMLAGYQDSRAESVNNKGQVVGNCGSGDVLYGFLWQGGLLTDFSAVCGGSAEAWSINDAGQVAGEWTRPEIGVHAAIFQDGAAQSIGTLAEGWAWAQCINSAGQVVGASETMDGFEGPFVWRNGLLEQLPCFPGGWNAGACGINDSGVIVGSGDTLGGQTHACLWQGSEISDLGSLAGSEFNSWAASINNSGQVVGLSDAGDQVSGFLWQNGAMTELTTLTGGWYSEACGINNTGQIVGRSEDSNRDLHAVLWEPGQEVADLNTLIKPGCGFVLQTARDINDQGWIVADAIKDGDADKHCHAILLTPAVAPKCVSISPNQGSVAPDTAVSFASTYSDENSCADVAGCYMLINETNAWAHGIRVGYDREKNELSLMDDAGENWIVAGKPGSAGVAGNSQGELYCDGTTVEETASGLTIHWKILIKQSMSGMACGAFMMVMDKEGMSSGCQRMGSVDVTAMCPPQCDSLTPSTGTIELDKAQNYTACYSDPDGCEDLTWEYIWFTFGEKDEDSVCVFYYQAENALYVWDHDKGLWVGGYAPGSPNMIETAMAKVDCSKTTVTRTGTRIIVDWSLALCRAATDVCNVALQTQDRGGENTGWVPKGSFNVITCPKVNTCPKGVSISPNSGLLAHDACKVFTTKFTDADGCEDLKYCDFMIHQTTTDKITIWMRYDVRENKLYTRTDYGTWAGGVCPGTKATLGSGQFILYCDKTTVTKCGTDLTIQWSVRLGLRTVTQSYFSYGWLSAEDCAGLKQDWCKLATYVIK